MSIHVHWYLPTNGDSRDIVGAGDRSPGTVPTSTDFRSPTVDYLGQVARSAEQLGYEAVLTPTGTWCEDAWIFTAALSQVTKRLKFLVAFRPGFISPTLAAHQAATFQQVSHGRRCSTSSPAATPSSSAGTATTSTMTSATSGRRSSSR